MSKPSLLSSNFAYLQEHDVQLLRLDLPAERYFPEDPNTSLLQLRQLVATKVGMYQSPEESQYDLLRRLQDQGILPREVDVPELCNLVFLRRVNSRILFDQMLGRATRLGDETGKETLRIFDAVNIYEALQGLTAMQPVVVNPAITFAQLAHELVQVAGDEVRALVRDQFIVKLQRKKCYLSASVARDFETLAGMSPTAFIEHLQSLPLADIAVWFAQNPDLGEILDRQGEGHVAPVFVSHHDDRLLSTKRGYGQARRPEDYLKEFTAFVRANDNTIPALIAVLTRPRELTRKQLRELAMELDKADFSKASLSIAWREMTNQDIAARIVDYIRQAAIGNALVPYDQRVDQALQKLLASRQWSTPQRQWLQRIAAQTKANILVDREALDDPNLVFKREGGGFSQLDRIFGGELQQVLLALSRQKCWCSEAKDCFSHWDVEHYRPKKSAKDADGTAHEGYWWLAFAWHNCRICGNAGNRKNGTFFPLRPGCARVSAYGDIRYEDAQLLDPIDEDDPGLLSFNLEGRAIPAAHLTDAWGRHESSTQSADTTSTSPHSWINARPYGPSAGTVCRST